jgi:hypothetical protein
MCHIHLAEHLIPGKFMAVPVMSYHRPTCMRESASVLDSPIQPHSNQTMVSLHCSTARISKGSEEAYHLKFDPGNIAPDA